jgi:hypothetical protein
VEVRHQQAQLERSQVEAKMSDLEAHIEKLKALVDEGSAEIKLNEQVISSLTAIKN